MSPTEQPLPPATIGGMAGLLEILAALGGREDLPDLAHELNFEVDDLLPLVDAVVLLGFATVEQADLELTPTGRTRVAADILTSKQLFAQQARERAPMVRAIPRSLATTNDGTLNERFFLDLLRRGFSEEEARRHAIGREGATEPSRTALRSRAAQPHRITALRARMATWRRNGAMRCHVPLASHSGP